MNKLLLEIDQKKVISLRDYEEISKIAKEKGGFVNNSYRREFYKKAFKLEDCYINFIVKNGDVFKNENHHIDEFTLNNFQEDFSFETSNYYQYYSNEYRMKKKKNEYIIEVDVNRTIANNYFIDKDAMYTIKRKLTQFLKIFFRKIKNFQYYQGFHDIAMYFFLLFYNYEHLAVQILHRFSEFYLKDYLVEKDYTFRFETVFNVMNSMMKKSNKSIASLMNSLDYPLDPIFCLPWVITFFTHDIDNMFMTLRLFDYFLFTHPSSVYTIVSELVVKEVGQIMKNCGSRIQLLV
jgi:hypothetical protein